MEGEKGRKGRERERREWRGGEGRCDIEWWGYEGITMVTLHTHTHTLPCGYVHMFLLHYCLCEHIQPFMYGAAFMYIYTTS